MVGTFPQTLADSGGGVIDPNPSAGRILGAAEGGIGEVGVAPIYPSDGEGVLFSYKFVRTLLALTVNEQGRSRRVGRDRGSDVYHHMIDQRR